MLNFNLGDFLFGDSGILKGFLKFTQTIYNFLFEEISFLGLDISLWQIFIGGSVAVLITIFIARLI